MGPKTKGLGGLTPVGIRRYGLAPVGIRRYGLTGGRIALYPPTLGPSSLVYRWGGLPDGSGTGEIRRLPPGEEGIVGENGTRVRVNVGELTERPGDVTVGTPPARLLVHPEGKPDEDV